MPTKTAHRAAPRSRGRHPRKTPLQATQTPILQVAGVTARTAGGRILLDDVSFTVEQGWLVAIVGPTGAGKTSLARALTGSLALRSGSIRVAGDELTHPGSHALDRVAFVPQDDVLHGQLALGRTLSYAASLRVPPAAGADERDRRVDAALADLGLQHHAGVAVSSLSGGQRKRANIAAELVGEPDLLVLDEPTSGLDPGYEKAVMTSLRELADAGRTVVAVTHSLQALESCDRVLFLAEGGRVAYFGPPARAAAYFGRGDAADVFMALDTEPGQAWQERFRAHPAYAKYVSPVVAAATRTTERRTPPVQRDRPSWSAQLGMLLRRQVALLRSDRRHLSLLMLQGPVLGALLWLVVHHDSLGVLPGSHTPTPAAETVALFLALSATWLGASNAVREVVKERHILRREVDAGLAPSAYVASKAIVLGAVTMLQTTVLTLIACAGQHPTAGGALGSSRLELAFVAALVGLAATTLGLALSAVATAPDRALALLPMTLVTELVLAGRWAADLATPGLGVLRDLTAARWGVQAIGATVSGDAGTWLRSAAVLLLLAGLFFAVSVGMVHHHTRSALGRVSPVERLGALNTAARQRGSAVLGVATVGLFAAAVSIAVGGTGHDPAQQQRPAVAAPVVVDATPAVEVAPAPTTTAPAVTVPSTVPTTVAAVPVTTPTTAPAPTTTTTAAPAPTTTTTAPAPTTTSTTPTTTPASSAPVSTASTSTPVWWSPWYWASR